MRSFLSQKRSVLLAIVVVALAYFLQDPFVHLCIAAIKHVIAFSKPPAPNVLTANGYLRIASLRCLWWIFIIRIVFRIDPESLAQCFAPSPRAPRQFLGGLLVGFFVMAAIILTSVLLGDAQLASASGTVVDHALFGLRWLFAEIIGAAGEELLYRVLIFLLGARLLGVPAAAILSSALFTFDHGGNPGASWIWLVRLFAAGLLLCYSLVRTRTLWWAIGYHAGWNYGSAPTFGAAGSGYINQGHILTYSPTGSALITGGNVGPEGSVLAFAAVLVAAVLLIVTNPADPPESTST